MALQIRPMTSTIGAHITGIDLAQEVSADDLEKIRRVWNDYLIIVFPGQHELTPSQHIRFARHFGKLEVSSSLNSFAHPEYPEIFLLSNEKKEHGHSETRDVGWTWHTDLTFSKRPAAGAALHARKIPRIGGDTMFANLEAAYASLSPAYQAMLKDLWLIHDHRLTLWQQRRDNQKLEKNSDEFVKKNFPVRHPMVRYHPETGRPSLLVGQSFNKQIHGMTEAESRPILQYLLEHATQAEFVYRHHWNVGDLLMWDNRSTMHRVVADHDAEPEENRDDKLRILHRVTLLGEHDTGIEVES